MCDDLDAELFLCIPRIIWLRFLEEPNKCQELLRSFLPHHFPSSRAAVWLGNGFEGLVQRFCHVQQLVNDHGHLFETSSLHAEKSLPLVWELLTRRAVAGPIDSQDLYVGFVPNAWMPGLSPFMSKEEWVKAVREAVELLMNELEMWSMELQRHSPEEWNQCVSLLLRCLRGTVTDRTSPAEFHV